MGDAGTRELVDRFVRAWEAADLSALLEVLTEDVVFSMPPLPAWFDGRRNVSRFLGERAFATSWRLVPVTANGQPACVCYRDEGAGFRLGALNVLSVRDGRISWIAGFVDPLVLRDRLGLPEIFPGDR